jgi:NADPH:quinone reductase-like Zn-dependent oxidoreductase
VIVRVLAAALNRLDEMTVAERSDLPAPAVIGSDAAGVVVAVGDGVTPGRIGQSVVVLPSLWWGSRDAHQGDAMEILGYPTQGTHAELVAVPVENVFAKPARLSWVEAAALPLAGVTAFRAVVTRGQVAEGQHVIVTAASSGVSSFVIQIASALGAQVTAVTSDTNKLAQALHLGATAGVLRTDDGLKRLEPRSADVVIDSTGAEWPALLDALRPGGRLVTLGKKAQAQVLVNVQPMFWRQLSIVGTSMGSPRDFAGLLKHVETHAWAPTIDSVYGLEQVAAAYARLDHPGRFGKVVLAMSEAVRA